MSEDRGNTEEQRTPQTQPAKTSSSVPSGSRSTGEQKTHPRLRSPLRARHATPDVHLVEGKGSQQEEGRLYSRPRTNLLRYSGC